MRRKYKFKNNDPMLRNTIDAPPAEKRWVCRADTAFRGGVICTPKTGGKEGTLDHHQTCGWIFG